MKKYVKDGLPHDLPTPKGTVITTGKGWYYIEKNSIDLYVQPEHGNLYHTKIGRNRLLKMLSKMKPVKK